MNDAATAVEAQEVPVTPETPAPTTSKRPPMSEESRKKLSATKKAFWAAKKAEAAALTPAKTKGMTMAIHILEAQKAQVKVEYANKLALIKAECEEVLASFDELIADAKAKASTK
jgi:hypothetical protein